VSDDTRYDSTDIRHATITDLIMAVERRTANGDRPDIMLSPKERLAAAIILFDDLKGVLAKDSEMTEIYPKVLAIEVVMQEWLESISALYAIAQGLNVSGDSATVEP